MEAPHRADCLAELQHPAWMTLQHIRRTTGSFGMPEYLSTTAWMSSSTMPFTKFQIKTRVFPGQHIRNYPGATRTKEEEVQYLEVKQYTPLTNLDPQEGDITILATCATGFPKEMYEPLWDELLTHCSTQGLRIRSIWCLDKSDHGGSGILNELTQGDDPSYFDLARDILLMTNTFREHMTLPLVGIGHSMGATALLEVARIHPRLFSSLVLTDPIIGSEMKMVGATYTFMSSRRPDLWDSRKEAENMFRSAKPLKAWDARVMDLWLQYGLRETPTLLYPEPGKVTLRMPKTQEVWNYARSYFDGPPEDASDPPERSRIKYPDALEWIADVHPFYRSEGMAAWDHLPQIRCSVLYLFPAGSPLSTKESMGEKVARTGSVVGGSGGTPYGRTAREMLQGSGHLAPFEKPGDCAEKAVEWLARDIKAWQRRTAFEKKNRDDKSITQIALSEEWMRKSKEWFDKTMPKQKRKPKL
ncbi:uncharacterized protein LTR77_002779 [Saxophila tyrrhenica]|uniref:AB hydrolase-1 domain-containing protein n=1 Tax=Saxophila tyrrhenica TaxID=1690608 RepID=A0AAV9PFX1_9PEZI|nr:hypothetical protein LTR77_002779 [Saxophila tyrrhenica]